MGDLAIIPARSGSKGLPDKNIKPLDNKPLLAYSIEAALASGCFDKVMVSTDSEAYAEIATSYGAEVPFLRSAATASDTASSWDMVKEVLANYKALGFTFDTFMLLQPTSPLRTAEDIQTAYKIFYEKNANVVVSVCEAEHSPLICGTLSDGNSMQSFFKDDIFKKRRQDIPTYYRINGAGYLLSTEFFLKNGMSYSDGCYAHIMDAAHSVDIDTELDFQICRAVIEYYKGK